MTSPLDQAALRTRVQECIDTVLIHQREVLSELGPDPVDLLDRISALLSGGKRLRAAFLYWGYRAGGRPDSDGVIQFASAMEFFQAAALIHDDVMDESDTRRGMPSAHRALEALHSQRSWMGDPARFGLAGAVLAGNLCLTWTDELAATCGLDPADLARSRPIFDQMRSQLMAGQFLDVVEAARSWDDDPWAEQVRRAQRVIRYKSAKYTVEQPLLIGASSAQVGDTDLAALSDYGLDLGHAFQLRDDVLGVFGDPQATGKPAGDDLREGKRTVLIAHALHTTDDAGREALRAGLGRADASAEDIAAMRRIITDSGAVDVVEDEIAGLAQGARAALARATGVTDEAAKVLADLVDVSTARAT